MTAPDIRVFFLSALLAVVVPAVAGAQTVVVAEGEKFVPQGDMAWKVTHQELSYASHNYGGMWMSQAGCLGAPAESKDSMAFQKVAIPAAGDYRVWSKYQAPPYFNYMHRIEIHQNGAKVFEYVYGKASAPKLWSFAGAYGMGPIAQCWWEWGMDHDAAEAPYNTARLAAGEAEIRLYTVANVEPAGDRYIDFVILTTAQGDSYVGYKPFTSASPFIREALAATKLYMRFKNTGTARAKLSLARGGHYQPDYNGGRMSAPDAEVAPGQWSPWFNIGPFCVLVHDEGLWLNLPGASSIPVQVSLSSSGESLVGDTTVPNGEALVVPMDITWNSKRRVMASRDHAKTIADLCRKVWRTANNGRKPKDILYYGAFRGKGAWVDDLKDAIGYNTILPGKYERVAVDGYYQHCKTWGAIEKFAKTVDKTHFKVLSFGDEITLGEINYNDPAMQAKFSGWLKAKGLTKSDIGVEPDQARLADRTFNKRVGWYAQMFNEEEIFGRYRAMTELAKSSIGPQVETGANYSPHHVPLYYGPIYQWVDIFRHKGMTMFWGEDYIFSVPHYPQMISWMMATMRCAVKYNKQKIHIYIMPHAPGQTAAYLRRNMVYAVGAGANHIDNFWVAPAEDFTENYVSWNYVDSFKALHESIYDAAAAEVCRTRGTVRPARIAVVLSKATDHNERNTRMSREQDPFAAMCGNAPATIEQVIDRVEAQLLFVALKQAGRNVDLVTEDDITEGCLKNYSVVYFAGEWIDHRAIPKLDAWVQGGGVLYAAAGCGVMNEFGEPEKGLLKLLGLKSASVAKSLVSVRPLLELQLAKSIDTIAFDGAKIPAVGMRAVLEPDTAKVLGTWADGTAAVTAREYGKGKAFAVGTLPGSIAIKSATPVRPWARGGFKAGVVLGAQDPAAAKLVLLGVNDRPVAEAVVCSEPRVEAMVMDNQNGSLLTLVNWTDKKIAGLRVSVRLPAPPREVRSVQQGKILQCTYANGSATFTTPLDLADHILLFK